MRNWLAVPWRRGAKRSRALRPSPRLERLEERTLLTSGLHVVPSPTVAGSQLIGTAAISASDIWAVGQILTGVL
jgi:hypothetical protein